MANARAKRVSLEVRNALLCKMIQRKSVHPALADYACDMRGISDYGGINTAVGPQVVGKGTNGKIDIPGIGGMRTSGGR